LALIGVPLMMAAGCSVLIAAIGYHFPDSALATIVAV
jgi:hypothetical protein